MSHFIFFFHLSEEEEKVWGVRGRGTMYVLADASLELC